MPERKPGKRTAQRKQTPRRRSTSKDRKQFERFLETARLHGVMSDAETLFDSVLHKLLRPPQTPQRPSETLALGK